MRPPETVKPSRVGTTSTVESSAFLISRAAAAGSLARRAAKEGPPTEWTATAPVTWGVAMEVPERLP